jgi:predicted DNA-binding protein
MRVPRTTPVIGCRVTNETYEALESIAVNRGLTVSELLRDIICRLIAEDALEGG